MSDCYGCFICVLARHNEGMMTVKLDDDDDSCWPVLICEQRLLMSKACLRGEAALFSELNVQLVSTLQQVTYFANAQQMMKQMLSFLFRFCWCWCWLLYNSFVISCWTGAPNFWAKMG